MQRDPEEFGIIRGKRFCQHCQKWQTFFEAHELPDREARAWARNQFDNPWWVHPRCEENWKKELAKQSYVFGRQPGFTAFCRPGALV